MEHIEEAGIHSGDSACSLPAHSLPPSTIARLEEQTRDLALALQVDVVVEHVEEVELEPRVHVRQQVILDRQPQLATLVEVEFFALRVQHSVKRCVLNPERVPRFPAPKQPVQRIVQIHAPIFEPEREGNRPLRSAFDVQAQT